MCNGICAMVTFYKLFGNKTRTNLCTILGINHIHAKNLALVVHPKIIYFSYKLK